MLFYLIIHINFSCLEDGLYDLDLANTGNQRNFDRNNGGNNSNNGPFDGKSTNSSSGNPG